MQERHLNREIYFKEQVITTKKYVIPYLEDLIEINNETSVMEIGCGEGGNLMPFADIGCKRVVGVDLSENKINVAKKLFSTHPNSDRIEFYDVGIYKVDDLGKFDLIILRDVIEHIHDQEKFMGYMQKFLHKKSKVFFAFPPWYNPFGGHQQMCKSRILSKLPFFHILPNSIYGSILKGVGESERTVNGLLEIKETGITIERFEKILKRAGYKTDKKTYYFINPNYETKFNLKPRKQAKVISSLPFIRNFFTTAAYYVVSPV